MHCTSNEEEKRVIIRGKIKVTWSTGEGEFPTPEIINLSDFGRIWPHLVLTLHSVLYSSCTVCRFFFFLLLLLLKTGTICLRKAILLCSSCTFFFTVCRGHDLASLGHTTYNYLIQIQYKFRQTVKKKKVQEEKRRIVSAQFLSAQF